MTFKNLGSWIVGLSGAKSPQLAEWCQDSGWQPHQSDKARDMCRGHSLNQEYAEIIFLLLVMVTCAWWLGRQIMQGLRPMIHALRIRLVDCLAPPEWMEQSRDMHRQHNQLLCALAAKDLSWQSKMENLRRNQDLLLKSKIQGLQVDLKQERLEREKAEEKAAKAEEKRRMIDWELGMLVEERDYVRQQYRSSSQLACPSAKSQTQESALARLGSQDGKRYQTNGSTWAVTAVAGSSNHYRNGDLSIRDDTSQEELKSLKEELRVAQVIAREHLDGESRAKNEVDRLAKMLRKTQMDLDRCQEMDQPKLKALLRKDMEADLRKEVAIELRKEYHTRTQREVEQKTMELETHFGKVLSEKTAELNRQYFSELDVELKLANAQHQHQVGELQSVLSRTLSESAAKEGLAQQQIGSLIGQVGLLQGRVKELEAQNGELTNRLRSLESMPLPQAISFPQQVLARFESIGAELAKPPSDRPDRYGHVREPKLLGSWLKELESILTHQTLKWGTNRYTVIRDTFYRALTNELSTLQEIWDPLLQKDMNSLRTAVMVSGIGRAMHDALVGKWTNRDEAEELLGKLKDLLDRMKGLDWLPKKQSQQPAVKPPLGLLAPKRAPSVLPRLNPPQPVVSPFSSARTHPSPRPPTHQAQLPAPYGLRHEGPVQSDVRREVEQPVAAGPPSQPQESSSTLTRKRSPSESQSDLPDAKRRLQG